MMKKSVFAAIFLCLSVLLCPFSLAADNEYYIVEFDMSISLPEDFAVFTRYTSRDDEQLAALGIDYDLLMDTMESSSYYLDAVTMDLSYECTVKIEPITGIADFSAWTDDELAAYGEEIRENYLDEQVTYYSSDVYSHAQTKFLRLRLVDSSIGTDCPFLRYLTIVNQNMILFDMVSYTGSFPSEQEAMTENIVGSMVFHVQDIPETQEEADPSLEPPQEETPPFQYEDPESGVTFTVPANWREATIDTLRPGASVSDEDWNMLLDYYKIAYLYQRDNESALFYFGYTDNPEPSVASIEEYGAEILKEMHAEESTTVKYNNTWYIQGKYQTPDGNSIVLTCMDAEYIYFYAFSGLPENARYPDFQSIMESITYTISRPAEKTGGLGSALFLVFSYLVIIFLFLLPILIYRYGYYRTNLDRKRAIPLVIVNGIAVGLLVCLLVALGKGSFILSDFLIVLFLAIVTGAINYLILTKKTKREKAREEEQETVQQG